MELQTAALVSNQIGNKKLSANTRAKVIIIGTGEFGTALAQSSRLATISSSAGKSFSSTDMPRTQKTAPGNVDVVSVSARAFLLNQSADEMAAVIANSRYIMYCGSRLTQHSQGIAEAMIKAKPLSTKEPLVDFIDWSNPDPGVDANDDLQGAVMLARFLRETDNDSGTEAQKWKVWKATGVSNLDIAGHMGKTKVTIYGEGWSESEGPAIKIPGVEWRVPRQYSLLDEVYDRLIARSEVDRWYDAFLLSLAIFIFTFVYAYTRYSEHVNGNYPDTMVPMYIVDKGIAWCSLWMMVVCPFAGNILAMGAAMQDNWSATTVLDKIIIGLSAVITIVPLILFCLPWGVWCAFRHLFFMDHKYNSKAIYERQDDKPGESILKASLIDMVSLKHETGVVGFFWAFAHCMLGFIISDAAYKVNWFQENGRLYGNNEASLVLGVVGFTLITAVTIRSLFGSDYWMKLKPMYVVVSPIGILFSSIHVVLMGYKGWHELFDVNVKNGHPSITFMSSMFPLFVLLVNFFLNTFGTKKRAGGQTIWKHSATNAAHSKYMKTAGQELDKITINRIMDIEEASY